MMNAKHKILIIIQIESSVFLCSTMIPEILHIFLIYCIPSVNAWNLPPSKFLHEFAKEHDRKNIILHLPENSQSKWIKW